MTAPAVPTRSSCGDNADIKDRCWYGVIDKSGRYIVQPKYGLILDYSEGFAAFLQNDKWGFIDRGGSMLSSNLPLTKYFAFSDGAAPGASRKKSGAISPGPVVGWFKPRYRSVGAFSAKCAPRVDQHRLGLYQHLRGYRNPCKVPGGDAPLLRAWRTFGSRRDEYAWIRS